MCFVGVVGSKETGKSFFCDKIYNLADVQGNKVFVHLYLVLPKESAWPLYLFDSLHQRQSVHIFGLSRRV